ncbi:LysM peptidoglycan-binding domain-containing protein [Shewanella algicola]|uniref:LysM peptidoglycan-binding domain-containing protein n=1 Tax=Shewanella algicola TaxID=640633 RepID=UPI0024954448|nr:LysM peptidoglycan-binding domain-containing protein [Shewanella algicola]
MTGGRLICVVPVSKAHKFKQALANTDVAERMQWYKYIIQPGDNIGIIAKRHQTTVAKIKHMNDINGDKIIAGDFLYMPHTSSQVILDVELAATQSARPIINQPSPAKATTKSTAKPMSLTVVSPTADHTVKYGDTLWSIAKVYNVSVEQIIYWNNMTHKDKLSVGKKLKFYQVISHKQS